MLTSTVIREAAAAAALAGHLLAYPAAAQEVSFAGKKIDMYIGSSPGGGTDLSSRLIGDFVVKYLPGKPTIVYRNIPGGQGVKALNYFAKDVKPDGTGFA
ncbi:MAG: Bug family tripartite tricarboxylate transporter substrate binding protein, partial [Gammaproteobacteria bacterium]